jgi:hypothetical protein
MLPLRVQYEYPAALNADYGEPVDAVCQETAPQVFTRKWTKATVSMDCNTYTPSIIFTADGGGGGGA